MFEVSTAVPAMEVAAVVVGARRGEAFVVVVATCEAMRAGATTGAARNGAVERGAVWRGVARCGMGLWSRGAAYLS